ATAVVIMYCFTPTEAFGLLPSFETPTSIKGWMTLLGLYESSDKWLTDYIQYLNQVLEPPKLQLPVYYVITAWTTIVLLAMTIYVGFKNPL
ncbi:MAG: hypothetical protein NZ941_06480, partial [Candidatus Caldarchaeum sp.]|nr:hypothetical protein [Candidatus Caldarchaeum sp.]